MTNPFVLDGSYRRHGRVVIAGSPLRLFRLSPAGCRVVEAIERNEPLPTGHSKLTDRLVDAGAIHPVPTESAFTTADVTIVVPSYNSQSNMSPYVSEVIVVDDGSQPPLTMTPGRRTIRLPVNAGPAAARNAGLAEVTTTLVAFVDTDVDLDDRWLDALLPHFSDPRVALVAPRVLSADGTTLIATYETARSPLDVGPDGGRIASGSRVGYVPAAALVVRAAVLRAIGGFDETMRSGEDVDMVWRLLEAGHRCRYEPSSIVHHRPRTSFSAWARQRVTYGRSAAVLDRKHPGAVAPLRVSGWSATVWTLVLARRPIAAVAVAAGTTVALRRKLHDLPAQESLRLAGLGHLYAGRQVAGAITRTWWPLALICAVLLRRSRLPLFAAATVPPLLDWFGGQRPLDPVRYVALRFADDIAYGTGVWIGVIEQRSVGALAPKFTNWPGRSAR
ncbi:MAG TPA: mycofactocin biosynthesis glycosyltransferase MftF [Ilumatobacteraceae bacterium]|nr:mycofactocin biosynthesis glycosyltransferase MftF [Ilumatobacteraceae bacterium]